MLIIIDALIYSWYALLKIKGSFTETVQNAVASFTF